MNFANSLSKLNIFEKNILCLYFFISSNSSLYLNIGFSIKTSEPLCKKIFAEEI